MVGKWYWYAISSSLQEVTSSVMKTKTHDDLGHGHPAGCSRYSAFMGHFVGYNHLLQGTLTVKELLWN
eukprot:5286689-Amphidinium_carterae.1